MNRKDIVDRIWPIIGDIVPRGPYSLDISEPKNRNFIESIVRLAEINGNRDDLPQRCGSRDAVYQKFNRWTRSGTWERIGLALCEQEEAVLDFDGRRIAVDLGNPKSRLRLTRRIHRRSVAR